MVAGEGEGKTGFCTRGVFRNTRACHSFQKTRPWSQTGHKPVPSLRSLYRGINVTVKADGSSSAPNTTQACSNANYSSQLPSAGPGPDQVCLTLQLLTRLQHG